ncbi:MAG TPA: hypothetical protein VFS43_47775 [Polyangiaceae bacterium]|nr:hypothetical protein [Polyangiaceae bacterium]
MLQAALKSRLPRASRVEVLYGGEDHAAALVGPCLTLIARREPGPNYSHEAPRWVDRLLEAYPQKGVAIVVVQASAPPPTEAGRARIDRAYVEYGRGVTGLAMVIEGKGFVAASIRSVLSLIQLKSRYPYPIKTFAKVSEGAEFVVTKLVAGSHIPAAQIVSGVEDLRAAYEGELGRFTAGSAHVGALGSVGRMLPSPGGRSAFARQSLGRFGGRPGVRARA